MKKLTLFSILIVISIFILNAEQKKTLSPYSKVMLERYFKLENNLNNDKSWENYLYVFPKTKYIFNKVFFPEDFSELYDNSDDYIKILKRAPTKYLDQIIRIIFRITKNGAPGCCDPWSSLHMLIVELAFEYPSEFSNILKRHPINEQKNIIAFMADWEAIAYSEEYERIIEKLRELKETRLTTYFDDARKKRAAQRHD